MEEKEEAECQYNELDGKPLDDSETSPAEEPELTALKEYIFDNGFTEAGVAMHIVMLCSQPSVCPVTTNWDFADRAKIPEIVWETLKTPDYLGENLWPSLRIMMGANKANTAWTAEIAITLAFFDVIRTLPVFEILKKGSAQK